jgi:molybdopterin-guanine dinucleotide biosynthesis protein A
VDDDGLLLILAGGASLRMGQPKALLPLHEGTYLAFLERLVEQTEGLPGRRAMVSHLPPEQLPIRLPVVRHRSLNMGKPTR